MGEELEKIGLEAVFILDDFLPKASQYKVALADVTKATYDATNRMAKAAVSSKDVDDKVAGFAARLEDVSGAAKLYNARLQEMYERKAAVQAQTAMFVDALHKEGRSFEEIANAMGVSQEQLLKVFQNQGWAIEEIADATGLAIPEINKMIAAQNEEANAVKKTDSYIMKYLKRMALWLTLGAAVRGAVRFVTQNLKEGFKALYENTTEYKNLTDAADRFRNSIVLSIAPLDDTLELMERLADAANRYADAMERHVAARETGQDVTAQILAQKEKLTPEERAKVGQMAYQQLQGGALTEAQLQYLDELSRKYDLGIDVLGQYNTKLEENREATRGTTEEEEKMADAAKDLAEILRDTDEELDRHKQAISAIHAAYDEAAAQAMVDYYQESQKIAADAAAEIEKIEADALADIEKIRAKGEKRITDMINRAQKDRVNDEERHQLEMAFRRRRFELSQVQNERMYQARRRRLVGEGDVLAIEELDEQYELQKQAAEENFKLQMEQAEAMYQLQARVQEESMARQIQALRDAMAEQIAEVEAAKAEEIAQVQAAAEAEAEAAKQARDKELYDAKVARDQDLADEEATHQERLVALGERFRQLEERYDLGLARITKAVQNAYGVGSEMDNAVRDAFERWKMYADQAAAYIAGTGYGGVVQSGGAGYYGGSYYGSPGRGPYGYQAGTTGGRPQLFSQPTLIEVAEDRSEMVSVQPAYGGGSATMSLSWQGGPIPLRGEGSLSGADLSQVASGITIAIMSRAKKAYQNMYAPGG